MIFVLCANPALDRLLIDVYKRQMHKNPSKPGAIGPGRPSLLVYKREEILSLIHI